jgi:hypothetical protein
MSGGDQGLRTCQRQAIAWLTISPFALTRLVIGLQSELLLIARGVLLVQRLHQTPVEGNHHASLLVVDPKLFSFQLAEDPRDIFLGPMVLVPERNLTRLQAVFRSSKSPVAY